MANFYVTAVAGIRLGLQNEGWRWEAHVVQGIILHAQKLKMPALVDFLVSECDVTLIADAAPTFSGAVRQSAHAAGELARQKMTDRGRVACTEHLERIWRAVQSNRFLPIMGVRGRARLALFDGTGGPVLAAWPSSVSTWREARSRVLRFDVPCVKQPEDWPADRAPLCGRARWPDWATWVQEQKPLRACRYRPESSWVVPA